MGPIIDGHLDLAMNAVAYDRDQTLSVAELRKREEGMTESDRGGATVSLAEMRRGGIVMCVATLFARADRTGHFNGSPNRADADSATPAIAHAAAMGQLAYYRLLERQRHLRVIETKNELDAFWPAASRGGQPLGCIVMIEGADPVTSPEEIAVWHEAGVRMLSMAHIPPTAYAFGNGGDGPMSEAGRRLLREMSRLGMALDTSHLSDQSFAEALDAFDGPVCATHTNCRALSPGMRQFSDEQIKRLIGRGGVMGVVMHNRMLKGGWEAGKSPRGEVTLETVAEHVDHICQLAGNARHAAIGSDLDGGFNVSRCPADLDTIADLRKLEGIFTKRGHRGEDLAAILHGNWLGLLGRALPA